MNAFKTVSQLVEEIMTGDYEVQRNAKADLKAKADTHNDYLDSDLCATDFYMTELEYTDCLSAFKAFEDNSKAYMLLINLKTVM